MHCIEIPTIATLAPAHSAGEHPVRKQSQALFIGKTTHETGDCFALRFDCVALGARARNDENRRK
jgi:hypothetical protein